MFIIGSYHKTGTVLFRNIFEKYKESDNNFNYTFNMHFNSVSNNVIKKTKCLVIIRHPYEIIMSGVRYHQITNKKWCHIPRKDLNGKTYQSYIKSLTNDKKILFEIQKCSGSNINRIYNDVKNRNFNNNIFFLKIEDLYIKENIPTICTKINDHFNNKINVNKLIQCFYFCLDKSYHRTHNINEYTFNKHFKKKHYAVIKKKFPNNLLEVLNYE